MSGENVFQRYLSKKYKLENLTDRGAGPVITISREIGCFAGDIAEKLVQRINYEPVTTDSKKKWNWISKEILEKSAEELKIKPERISHIFEAKKKVLLQDLADSLIKKYYVSDSQIIATIHHIIQSFAYEGRIVIVGRAAAVITNEMARALHIKLIAPVDFRIKLLCTNLKVTKKEAKSSIEDYDRKREAFIKFFRGTKPENDFYDVILNRANFDEEKIVDIIYDLAVMKKLF
ncbi:MAG: cytidylate kinase-like family protein [Bacteroidetes bacterium]|nr:MAG: cytidylate kinase-like family protein [Bacteroidota bacterium]